MPGEEVERDRRCGGERGVSPLVTTPLRIQGGGTQAEVSSTSGAGLPRNSTQVTTRTARPNNRRLGSDVARGAKNISLQCVKTGSENLT